MFFIKKLKQIKHKFNNKSQNQTKNRCKYYKKNISFTNLLDPLHAGTRFKTKTPKYWK